MILCQVGMQMRSLTNFTLAYSIAMIAGGKIAAACIARFGLRGYTTLSNLCCAVGYSCWALPRPMPMWAGLLIIMPGINAVGTSAVKAMAVDLAVSQGMGSELQYKRQLLPDCFY